MKLCVIQKKLSKYVEKCSETGELLAKPEYSRYHSVRIGEHVKSLMAWEYLAYYHRHPNGRVMSFSDNKQSVDPRFMLCSAELKGDIDFNDKAKVGELCL